MKQDLLKQLAALQQEESEVANTQKERNYHPAFDPLVRLVMENLFKVKLYVHMCVFACVAC